MVAAKDLVSIAVFGTIPLASLLAGAAEYPDRTVRIVAPSAPGGGADLIARVLAQGFTERLGRQVVVENKAGASTMLGTETVVKSTADGHTLLLGISTLAINASTFKHVPYDVLRDLAPITQAVSVPNIMIVNTSLPVKSVKELITFSKRHPRELLYSSPGQGTSAHLTMELFGVTTGTRMLHVPYKSQGPGLIAIISGEVSVMAPSITTALGAVRAGKLRALGVTSLSRAAIEPTLPTLAEQGLNGFEAGNWFGLLAPAATPNDIVARLHKEAVTILGGSAVKPRLVGEGMDLVASTPEQFSVFIREETKKWAAVAKAAGIRPE